MTSAEYRATLAPKKPATAPKPPQRVDTGGTGREAARGARKLRHLEDDLQATCVKWFRMQYGPLACLLFAIPNGGQRNAREGARLKLQGVTAGVPDLMLAVASRRAPGLFIELKVGRNKPSAAQEAHMKLLQLEGYSTAVVYTLEAFQEAVRQHLAAPKHPINPTGA
jgi:hypothetical protein